MLAGFTRPRLIALLVGSSMLGGLLLVSLVAPLVADPAVIDLELLSAEPPSLDHLLGTDTIGRDVLARTASAFLPTLTAAAVASVGWALPVVLVGAALGRLERRRGGRFGTAATVASIIGASTAAIVVTEVAMAARVAGWQAWDAISELVLGIASIILQSPGGGVLLVAGALLHEHVRAATRAYSGGSERLDSVRSALALLPVLLLGGSLAEHAVSFLGFGVQPPTATYGNMLAEARDPFVWQQYWWMVLPVAAAAAITALALALTAIGLAPAASHARKAGAA